MGGVIHGGAQDSELAALGLTAADVLDLSANLHPAGPDPRVIEAARQADLDRYPDPAALPLRAAIARAHGLDPECVLATPGGTAGIHLVARGLLDAGAAGSIIVPAFGEYVAAMAGVGATVTEVLTSPPRFRLDVDSLPQAAVTFLCNPDNPTGRDLSRDEVLRAVGLTRGTVVIDAAYEPFADRPPFASEIARSHPNVIAVHSMTKLHAVPGLRLGYIVATPERIAQLSRLQHSWAIDAPSIAAGIEAAAQFEARRAMLVGMTATREALRSRWLTAGLDVAPGAANFLLVKVGDARSVRRTLLAGRIVVRDASSFGLPEWIRVAVPSPQHQERIGAAVISAAARDVTG
ncbi:MAG: aminotransferase class I/II-fold pyridoxal phosphate-dependent enzyme [Dehalococcoidia bacterium]|nr:MAG: aminotransferase class I/II-fold pyridoxal phosphate-dependent enzyme [Dehalococcoidia bacterium]